MLLDNVMLVNEVQLLKQAFPILVILLGNIMLVNALQP